MAAALAAANGTRNMVWKFTTPAFEKTFCIRYGQTEFAARNPIPRIITLNKPCALARTSLGKYSSTKIYTIANKNTYQMPCNTRTITTAHGSRNKDETKKRAA